MEELLTGIYNLFNTSNSLNTALSGRFYLGFAPQGSSSPYGVYFVVTSNYDFMFRPASTGNQYEEVIIQMNFYSKNSSSSEVRTILGYAKTLFDFCNPTVSGYVVSTFERQWSLVEWIPEDEMWQGLLQYRVLLNK